MYIDLSKTKEKKEKKISEYYKSYFGGEGLDTFAIRSLKEKKYTKKRKLKPNSHHGTHKQIKSIQLREPLPENDKLLSKHNDKPNIIND